MTLFDRTRVLLGTMGVTKSFWIEIVRITYYVVNRFSSITIELKKPMEIQISKLVDYSSSYFLLSCICNI